MAPRQRRVRFFPPSAPVAPLLGRGPRRHRLHARALLQARSWLASLPDIPRRLGSPVSAPPHATHARIFASALDGFWLPSRVIDPGSERAMRLSGQAVFLALQLPRRLILRAMSFPLPVWMDWLWALRHGYCVMGWSARRRSRELRRAIVLHPRGSDAAGRALLGLAPGPP